MFQAIYNWFGLNDTRAPELCAVENKSKDMGRRKGNCPKMRKLEDFRFFIKDLLVNQRMHKKHVAEYMGVSYATFHNWIKANPDLGISTRPYTKKA